MCRYGMTATDERGPGLVQKPTGFLTNSEIMASRLQKKCLGGHKHVHLLSGKARAAQVYPEPLCHQILSGLKEQLMMDGVLALENKILQTD